MRNQVMECSISATKAAVQQLAVKSAKGVVMDTKVSNEVKPVSMTQAIEVMKRIEQIATEVSVWEKGIFTESNAILYGLLQKAYALYKDLVNSSDSNLKYKKQGLNDYLMLHDMAAYVDKSFTTKVIRAIFGNRDRRRLSTYNTVLKFLVKMNFAGSDIPSKIAEYGGVQEISLGRPEGFITPKQRAQRAGEAVCDVSVAAFKSEKLIKQINADAVGERFAAVLTYESDGSFSVNCVLQSNTAVNATLTAYYNTQQKMGKDKAKEAEVTKKRVSKTQAIDNAIGA